MAITTKELSTQLEEVTARLRAIESGQHVMTSSPGLPLDKWNDHGFVHRHEIKPLVRAINNGGGSAGELEERVEYLESGQHVLTSVTNQQAYEIDVLEAGQAVLTSAIRNKQDLLIAGSGIDITENVISSTGGSSIFDTYLKEVAAYSPESSDDDSSKKIGEDSNYNYIMLYGHKSSFTTGTQYNYYRAAFEFTKGTGVDDFTGYKLLDYRGSVVYSTERHTIPGAFLNGSNIGYVSMETYAKAGQNFQAILMVDSGGTASALTFSDCKLCALLAIPKT